MANSQGFNGSSISSSIVGDVHQQEHQSIDQTAAAFTISYISASNASESILPTMIINDAQFSYDDSGSWMFSSRDIPILIGAAAGAIGLILIFLAAALIWHCCQFALQREKSSYSLESDGEKQSVSSTRDFNHFYINNPIDQFAADDKSCVIRDTSDQNLKRSLSAPLHRDNSGLKSNTRSSMKRLTQESVVNIENRTHDRALAEEVSIGMPLSDKNEINCQRSHMYVTNHNHLNDDPISNKSKSLPWSQSNKRRTVTIDDEAIDAEAAKINFSKKRKNRMRNDSAAAIAINRSGGGVNDAIDDGIESKVKTHYSHKDTDALVDNEAIVVYDERTAL